MPKGDRGGRPGAGPHAHAAGAPERRGGRRRWWRRALWGCGAVAAAGVLYSGSVLARALWTLPPIGDPAQMQAAASVIIDRYGQVVSTVPGPEVRQPVTLGQVPAVVQNAFVAVEDRHFYQEGAISYRGFARAALADIRGRPLQGGSTITQQLAKDLYLTPRDTLVRKMQEAILGIELANRFSKAQILDMYLNDVFLGDHAYGVQAAAETYFGAPVGQLTLPQAALLAGLPQAPSGYDPLVHPQAALARRNTVLAVMAERGYITSATAAAAQASPLGLNPGAGVGGASAPNTSGYADPWFVDAVVEQLEQQDGLSPRLVASGGLRIYTTLDPKAYAAAQQAITAELGQNFPSNGAGNPMQAAAVLMDQQTGDVLALVGGRTHTGFLDFNRATQAEQQPGSTIKPLVDYIPALEAGYTPGTVVNDVVHTYRVGPGQPLYAPTDDNNIYYGLTTLTEALRRSVNTVAVQLLNRVGVAKGIATARRLGLTDLNPQTNDHLAVALGGTVNCCTPLEMADAYATIANGGKLVTPRLVIKVLAPDGRVLVNNPVHTKRVLDPRIAYVMTKMLETVDTPQPNTGWDVLSGPNDSNFGTGYDAAVQDNVPGWPMAAKTGTTNNNEQAWYVGYTPLYTGAVWVGRDQPQPQPGMYGGTVAGPILKATMAAALQGQSPVHFPRPAGIVQAPIDIMAPPWHVAKPGPLTPATAVREEWFVAGTQPTQADGLWVQAQVGTRNDGALWQTGCVGSPEVRTFLNLPGPYGKAWAQGIVSILGKSNWKQFVPLEASLIPPTQACRPLGGGRLGNFGRLFGTTLPGG